MAQSNGPFFEFRLPDPTASNGFVGGDRNNTFGTASSEVAPSRQGINIEMNTDLLPGAYSIWAAVFNNPAACPDGCNAPDLALPVVDGQIMWVAGGEVEVNPLDPNPNTPTLLNAASFNAFLELNQPAGPLRPQGTEPKGLTSLGAEIRPIIRYMGPASPDPLVLSAQQNSYEVGCEIIANGAVVQEGSFLCYDPQAAILAPVSMPNDFVTVTFDKTTELNPFDPNAIWRGIGKTSDGNEVTVTASGLATRPADGFVSISNFQFAIEGADIDVLLDFEGRYVPTGELTGDIFITGSRQSTLIASTTNGLMTVTGQVSFNPVPEPSARLLFGVGFFVMLVSVVRKKRRVAFHAAV